MLISDPSNLKEAERKALAEIERLRDALLRIANQMTVSELKENHQYEDADFEGAFDALIHIARRAMQAAT